MKTPRIDVSSAGDMLFRHCEKIVAACVGVFALLLAWWGVSAVRTLSVTDAQTPEAVSRVVTQARGHIERDARAPDDLFPKREPLADKIDPWRTPLVPWWTGPASPSLTITAAPTVAVLNRPLFNEAAKRGRPDVLPIEDLRAVAGLAILPVAAAAPGAAPVPPAEPAGAARKAEPGAGRRPPRGGDPLMDPSPLPGIAAGPQVPAEKGRVAPYVIVTGLIPVRKQQAEYRRRFESCGFRDPKRDSPLWSDFEIDRGVVGPDGKETWTTIDLAEVAKKRAADGVGVAAVPAIGVDPEFLLGATEDARSKQTTPIGFCSPLPQRLDGNWDLADLHPWFIDRVVAKLAAQGRQAAPVVPIDPTDAGPIREGPGFEPAEERPAEPVAMEGRVEVPEYRFFRFVDTDVAPGTTYRYRARLKVWNPNYDKNPERMRPHLTDPALAADLKLASANSAPTTSATVPDPTRIVVDSLRPEELKELKIKTGSSTVEVLVLAPSTQTGWLSLRALIADPGAVVDIDEKYNTKNQKDRARGEKITTRRLLVDARGRQDVRHDSAGEKNKPAAIAEPLEVICLRPDGSFEFASIDGSERLVDASRSTLPPRPTKSDSKTDPKGPAGPGMVPGEPTVRPGGFGL